MAISLLMILFSTLCISSIIGIPLVQSFSFNSVPLEFSPMSPFYNPTQTHYQRMTNILRRSFDFVSSITTQNRIVEQGQYVSSIPIDTPMSEILPVMNNIVPGKYSQCLIPLLSSNSSESGKLNFGSKATVAGPGVVSTPLIRNHPEVLCFVTLEAISVNNKRIEFPGSSFGNAEGKGNIFIDGRSSVLTILPQAFQEKLLAEVINSIELTPIVNFVDQQFRDLDLCYRSKTDFDFVVPEIIVHFSGGADVKLDPINTFFRLDDQLVCFSFKGDVSGFAIYGILAQNNFLIGFDTVKQIVSFKKTDCAKEK